MAKTAIEEQGWELVSAVKRHETFPDTFPIPAEKERRTLRRGMAAQVLFDIETRQDGTVVDRGVDRMWVIVLSATGHGYEGILDSEPGMAENLKLKRGDRIAFGPEHVCKIDHPPKEHLKKAYGQYFK